ncbi:TetR/AcrR family transcriptional regulator [Leifsonia sp. AG29]|uniref:TetR/AcrR family transcriptional regulator n=1 Tax=Leifsonia sp. AG29 TaxID=2598860 RepID=UPI00131DBE49|nr:TetR/AcrR family transcriptional regulator [Leifsonia sp. AG29]
MDAVSTSLGEEHAQPRPGRGRRPSAEVRAEILASAAGLLFAEGLGAVTFDRVSAESGASRTTLHKWWPTRGALAAEAYFASVKRDLDFVDTGDIESDVRTQLHAFARLMTVEPAGRAVRELIGAAQTDPALRAAFVEAYSRPRRQEAVEVLAVAKSRGQIRQDVSLEILVDQLWGACYHRLLLLDEPLDDRLVDEFVSNAFAGARPR